MNSKNRDQKSYLSARSFNGHVDQRGNSYFSSWLLLDCAGGGDFLFGIKVN